MIEVFLRYEGDGHFQTAARTDYELTCETLKHGTIVRAELTEPRSLRQNNYLHALIQRAHENQRGGPRFAHWKALRCWLLIECGCFTERRIAVPSATRRQAEEFGRGLALALRTGEVYERVAFDPRTADLIIRSARSLKFHGREALTGDEARALTDGVVAKICSEIVPGADPQELVAEARALVGAPQRKAA